MSNLLETLGAVAAHPLVILGLLATVGLWIVLGRKIRRLEAILKELRELPAQKRRYVLERKHKIYPGKGNLPITFTRKRRSLLRIGLLVWTVLFAGILITIAYRAVARVETLVWTIDDSRLSPERFGYDWHVTLATESNETVFVNRIDLDILASKRHSETDRKRPEYPSYGADSRKIVALKQNADRVSVVRPAENLTVTAKNPRLLRIFLDAYHPPHEGWVYDVRLVAVWHGPDQTTRLTKTGGAYRLGWPGMPHWSEEESSAGPGSEAVTDPVINLDE